MEETPKEFPGEFQPFYGRTGLLESRLLAPFPLPPPRSFLFQQHTSHSHTLVAAPPQQIQGGHAGGREGSHSPTSHSHRSPIPPALKWHPSSVFVVPQLLLHHLVQEGGELPSSFGVLLLLQHVALKLLRRWWSLGESEGKGGRADTKIPNISLSSSTENATLEKVPMMPLERDQSALLRFLLYWHYHCAVAYTSSLQRGDVPDYSGPLPLRSSSFPFATTLTASLVSAGALWRKKELPLLWQNNNEFHLDQAEQKEIELLRLKWFIPSLTLVGLKDRRGEQEHDKELDGLDAGSGGAECRPQPRREEVYPACSWRSVTLIGRDPAVNDIVVAHPSCSSQHAALQVSFHRTGWEEDEDEVEEKPKMEMDEKKTGMSTRTAREVVVVVVEEGGEEAKTKKKSFLQLNERMGHYVHQGTFAHWVDRALRRLLYHCSDLGTQGPPDDDCVNDDKDVVIGGGGRRSPSRAPNTEELPVHNGNPDNNRTPSVRWSRDGSTSSESLEHGTGRRKHKGSGGTRKGPHHQKEKEEEEEELQMLLGLHQAVSECYEVALDCVNELGGFEAAFSLELEIVDLCSTNGTYIHQHKNGDGVGTDAMQRLPIFTPHVLREGDSVRFGFSTRSFVVVRSTSSN